jgi:hypothetical protein
VHLLLLRPVLSSFITTGFSEIGRSTLEESLLSRRIFLQCAIECVRIAQEAIDTVYKERGASNGEADNTSAWWYNVLYLYTSATVLIAARLSSHILAQIHEDSILDRLNKAMEVLEGYGAFGISIQRLTATLGLLLDAIPRQYSRLRQPQLFPNALMPPPVTQAQGTGLHTSGNFTTSLDYNTLPPYTSTDILNYETSHLLRVDPLPDLDMSFDPTDVSWLMTVPLES